VERVQPVTRPADPARLPSLLAQPDEWAGSLVRLIPDWAADPVSLTLLCRPERLAAPPVAAVRRYFPDACGTGDFLETVLHAEAV